MIVSHLLRRTSVVLLACVTPLGAAHAEGLQVAPVSVTIPERSGVIWLNNLSANSLRAQVRVFRWQQQTGDDELEETEDLIASPPFAEVKSNGQQVVRLVRFGDPAVSDEVCEQTFRVIVDELPSPSVTQKQGLKYVLRYSVPVYLTNPACQDAEPELSWQIVSNGRNAWLKVVNSGRLHAQLANVSFTSMTGRRVEISGGLLGYVLPGAERRFALADPASTFASGGQIEVMVNGSRITEPLSSSPDSN